MTTTSTAAPAPASASEERKPAARLPRPPRSRIRPAMIGLGVALIILGGLATAWQVNALTTTTSVLTVTSDVTRGDTIESSDLGSMQVSGGQDVDAFVIEQQDEVVGQTALVDLPIGTLLTTANLGSELAVPDGSSLVGVSLTQAQLPSWDLSSGDTVRVVDTPVSQGDPPQETPESFEATVFTTSYSEETAVWVVDLIVPSDQAADIAARAASGRVALVLDRPGE